jgi:hypothetical protein
MARETKVFGENLTHCHSVHHKSHMNSLRSNPGRSGGNLATNRLSYGIVPHFIISSQRQQWWNNFHNY